MNIYSKLKSFIVPEISELQKLECQRQRLAQKSVMLQRQGKVSHRVDVELRSVEKYIASIYQNQADQQDSRLLQEAYEELDQEFPNIQSLLNRDRN